MIYSYPEVPCLIVNCQNYVLPFTVPKNITDNRLQNHSYSINFICDLHGPLDPFSGPLVKKLCSDRRALKPELKITFE